MTFSFTSTRNTVSYSNPFDECSVLDELQENARGFETFDSWFEHIKQLREELEEQAKSYKVAEGVNLSTLHPTLLSC